MALHLGLCLRESQYSPMLVDWVPLLWSKSCSFWLWSWWDQKEGNEEGVFTLRFLSMHPPFPTTQPPKKTAIIWSLVVLFEVFFRAIPRIREITASTLMWFCVGCSWILSVRDPFSETIGGDTWVANTKHPQNEDSEKIDCQGLLSRFPSLPCDLNSVFSRLGARRSPTELWQKPHLVPVVDYIVLPEPQRLFLHNLEKVALKVEVLNGGK